MQRHESPPIRADHRSQTHAYRAGGLRNDGVQERQESHKRRVRQLVLPVQKNRTLKLAPAPNSRPGQDRDNPLSHPAVFERVLRPVEAEKEERGLAVRRRDGHQAAGHQG